MATEQESEQRGERAGGRESDRASARQRDVEGVVARGLPAGLLGAAATAGALVGFGLREGTPGRFLASAGQPLLGVPSFVTPDRAFGPTAWLGVAQHVVVVLGWAMLFAAIAGRWRGGARWAAGVIVGVVVFVADGALPDALRIAGGALTGAQRAVVVFVLALTLVLGMRLAPLPRSEATRERA